MTTLTDFKRGLEVGTKLICLEHEYNPALVGTIRTITRKGSTVMDCSLQRNDGTVTDNWRWEWPKAKHVIEVTDTTLEYTLDQLDSRKQPVARLAGKRVKVRIVGPVEAAQQLTGEHAPALRVIEGGRS